MVDLNLEKVINRISIDFLYTTVLLIFPLVDSGHIAAFTSLAAGANKKEGCPMAYD